MVKQPHLTYEFMIIKTPEQHLQEIKDKAILRGEKLISTIWKGARDLHIYELPSTKACACSGGFLIHRTLYIG